MMISATRGVWLGLKMARAVGVTVGVASMRHSGSPFAGFNAVATAVGIGGRKPSKSFDPKATLAGAALLTGGLVAWGVVYDVVLGEVGIRKSLLTGAACAGAAFAFDKFALPSWVVPNFIETMGVRGTVAKYTSMAFAAR